MADCDNDQECEKIVPTPIKPEPLPKQCSGGGESGEGTNDFNELENRPKYGGRAMTGDTNIPEVETYEDFVGTDGEESGTAGLVPAPEAIDTGKFLKSDGTWAEAGGGSSVNVVQTAGTSPDDVMSQKAVTEMVFADPSSMRKIQLGAGSICSGNDGVTIGRNSKANQSDGIAIGSSAQATGIYSSTIGTHASSSKNYSVAVGAYATTTRHGEINVGTGTNNYGYNSSSYRVLGGVYDGQDTHDAVNVGQINTLIDAFNTATGASIPHIGA